MVNNSRADEYNTQFWQIQIQGHHQIHFENSYI